MKSKIEKDIFNLMNAYAIASNLPEGNTNETKLKTSEMAICVNSLVDLFNSQSQPEEKPIYVACMGETILGGTKESAEKFLNEAILSSTTEDMQDTPEEWEENLGEIIDNIDIKETPSKGDWLDREYKSALKDVVVCFIKQLLEERVEDILEQIQDWISSDKGGDIDDEYLNILIDDIEELKLNTKKK